MEPIASAPPQMTTQQLIQVLAKHINQVISAESGDQDDIDRVWLLRKVHKNFLYYRDLAYFAPALYQGLVDATGISGEVMPDDAWNGAGLYDWTQNLFRGYCRKLEAILGTRIPNAIAVPDDPSDEADVKAARAANSAAMYIREKCDLQVLVLWMVFSLYNFGTSFWTLEWVTDGDKYGWKTVEEPGPDETTTIGGGFDCPQCGAELGDLSTAPPPVCPECGASTEGAAMRPGQQVTFPGAAVPQKVPKGSLEIDITDASEVAVPLDADGRKGSDGCWWIKREREGPKSEFLHKWNGEDGKVDLRQLVKNPQGYGAGFDDQSAALQYGESIRSAMASPIGVVRPRRETRWTEVTLDWDPQQYEMIEDANARKIFRENFPDGIRITTAKGLIVDLEARKIHEHWQECQPEPTKRIMADPLGDDWIVTQDICNNLLNQVSETIERSNEPGFADPSRVDLDAWQRRRNQPADLIPAVPPAGRSLADIIHRPPPVQFSEQIPPWREQVEQTSMQNSGLLPEIWGGETGDPTARQTELKTNAAIRQLSVIWLMIGKSLEGVYEKGCAILSDHEDGVLAFTKSKPNQFGKYEQISVTVQDLKGGNFHFEADEAIPMTWGQQRDLAMWMMDKPPEILQAFGYSDPLNVVEMKSLLGIPGMRIPHVDARDKLMDVIGRLLDGQPQPGPANPDGTPGQPQASIQPDWEDDFDFSAKLIKAYLQQNFELAESNPQGYQNIVLYGQACEKRAQQPPPKPPVKASVALSLKGSDVGDPAVQAALQGEGIIPPGTQVQAKPDPKLTAAAMDMNSRPAPGMAIQ
jgi:hypothetical protein